MAIVSVVHRLGLGSLDGGEAGGAGVRRGGDPALLGHADLVALLPLLVHDDEVTQDLVVQTELGVHRRDGVAAALEPQVHVVPAGLVLDLVGQLAHAPVVALGDGAPVLSGERLDLRDAGLELDLGLVGLQHEDDLVLLQRLDLPSD
ncbi:MAG: hypothetical protein IPI34_11715 [bacterium]|nr:hypothetical protein [bacterium]